MYTTGLFLGRFQPFHIGHLDGIKGLERDCEMVKIAIGSSNKKNLPNNPLSFEQRERYIRAILEKELTKKFEIYAIPDVPGDDHNWFLNFKKIVGELDTIYSGNPEAQKNLIAHGQKIVPQERTCSISGSEIRQLIRLRNPKFLEFMYENQIPADLEKTILLTSEQKAPLSSHRTRIRSGVGVK